MKRLLFLCLLVSQVSLGSHVCDERIANCSPATVALYETYKQVFAAFFCVRASLQAQSSIEDRCGKYGLGDDWKSKINDVKLPFQDLTEITIKHGEVLDQVAQDMVSRLPDIADWLKQNAR